MKAFLLNKMNIYVTFYKVHQVYPPQILVLHSHQELGTGKYKDNAQILLLISPPKKDNASMETGYITNVNNEYTNHLIQLRK